MNVNNLKSCVTHDEATIKSFIRDPEYADYYLNAVIADGDTNEIAQVKAWYDEAKIRSASTAYWDGIPAHAQETASSGYGIKTAIAKLSEALNILNAALPAQANA